MSLTESCIAAAVIVTTMTIALPSLNRARETYALQAAAHGVAAQMHAARILAITRNRDCRLTVTSGTEYVLECQRETWQVMERIRVPDGLTVEANARPEFHWRGNVAPTASFTLRNASGATVRIIVNVNGRVRIQ